MPNRWVVVLEVAQPTDAGVVERERIHDVLHLMADTSPAALIAPDRCALQLHVVAEGPAEALLVALARWRDTSGRLCLPPWDLARAEVMLPAELERECDLAGPSLISSGQPDDTDARQLLEVAFRDPLTGVGTQAFFSDCLERALAQGAVVGRAHALVLVEFRSSDALSVSDPPSADEVLAAAAPQLVASVREADVIGRLISDQFAILLKNVTSQAADAVARRIAGCVRVPAPAGAQEFTATASVGMAVSHPNQSGDNLLQEAGAALLVAKRHGGSCSVRFTPSMLVPSGIDLVSRTWPPPPPMSS